MDATQADNDDVFESSLTPTAHNPSSLIAHGINGDDIAHHIPASPLRYSRARGDSRSPKSSPTLRSTISPARSSDSNPDGGLSLTPRELQTFLAYTLLLCKRHRERPLFSSEAQIFFLEGKAGGEGEEKQAWANLSSRPVPVHLYHDAKRDSYRIIPVEGSKPVLNVAADLMVMNKASSKFLQWLDRKSNGIYGLGFSSEPELTRFMDAVVEAQTMARNGKGEESGSHASMLPSVEPIEEWSEHISVSASASNESLLRMENDRLKAALAESSANAKKWEEELTALKRMNSQLTAAVNASANSYSSVAQKGQSVFGLAQGGAGDCPSDQEAILKRDNERLKTALADSSATAKKSEEELKALKQMNSKLFAAVDKIEEQVKEVKLSTSQYNGLV